MPALWAVLRVHRRVATARPDRAFLAGVGLRCSFRKGDKAMRSLIVLLILGIGADALAQSTRPTTRPAAAGIRRVATLREGAPPIVREWWARQPEFKADA